jgi:hypothetical protein
MRVRTIITAVSALGLLTVLTACGGGSVSASVEAHPASAPATSSTPTPTPPATTTKASPVVPVDATESAASFKAEFSIQRQDVGMVMLTNTSGHTVTVQGWPALTFMNQHGDQVAVPTQKVEVPGPGTSISVVAGGSVFAPVAWTDGDKADDSTIVADSVAVTPPGTEKPVDTKFVSVDGATPGYYQFAITSVKIGTFQPSTQNLLAF